jgi:type II secretory pathway component HofQ
VHRGGLDYDKKISKFRLPASSEYIMSVDAVHGSRLALSLSLSIFLFFILTDATLGGQQRISLDLRDADLVATIRLLAEIGGLNVVINEEVKGTVTVRVEDVSVDDALEVLFRTAGLAETRKGSLIGILPRETLLKQQREEAEARARPPVSFRTEIVKLQFANAMDLARTLTPFLSRWGKIATDKRTNSLIIRDTPNSSVFQLIGSRV